MPGNTSPEIVEIAPADRLSLVEAARILGVPATMLDFLCFRQGFPPEQVTPPPIRRIGAQKHCFSRVDVERARDLGFAEAVRSAEKLRAQDRAAVIAKGAAKLKATRARKRAEREACHAPA